MVVLACSCKVQTPILAWNRLLNNVYVVESSTLPNLGISFLPFTIVSTCMPAFQAGLGRVDCILYCKVPYFYNWPSGAGRRRGNLNF